MMELPQISFQKKYVAFIDVLGFKEMVNAKSTDKLDTYFGLVKSAMKIFNIAQELDYIAISDSLILIAADNEEEFLLLLRTVRTLQCTLAMKDIWLRGAITFGDVHCDMEDNIIVGKGYIRAYQLESQAIFPRVIIDPAILKKMGLTLKEFYAKLNTISDLHPLIHDYGFMGKWAARITPDDAIFVSYAPEIIGGYRQSFLNGPIEMIYQHIKDRLYGPQEYYHKYLWVKKYFTECILEIRGNRKDETEVYKYLSEMLDKFSAL